MNLFIIPSWYPRPTGAGGGSFTKEQAEAIAQLHPEVNVIMSLWGHNIPAVPVRQPWKWPGKVLWALSQPKNSITKHKGVHEVFNAKVQWSERLPLGGVKQLIKVNRKNLIAAQQKFGKMDIIHAHVSFPAGYVAAILAKEFNIPYVITEHMSPFPFPSLMVGNKPRAEIIHAFNNAHTSIAVSPSLAVRVASFGLPKPTVVPNVIDEQAFFINHLAQAKTTFFTLCGIGDQKGIDHLIQAIALWKPNPNQFEFRIGGDGPMLAEYQALAKELCVDNLINWLGNVSREEAPKLFQQCDIYIMPSRHETFGVVYAEATACGKPIIATRCGGPEFIVNKTNGVLVDVGDIEAISQAMQNMVKNLSNYSDQAIRADFEQRFSRPAVVEKLMEVYEQVIKSKA